ncbi:MAG: ABC transporter ATP-binding protein [Chloroflexi bacterium]|nr:ABC transporter ATP-binding protein [Chloroflexota bacterium]MBK6709352.1 ABC transporter ATP-binding protein [Chloroflexota bacterium]MBP6803684.1 ABC transporter ATP-binding protein [Chloroflexota bacterium]MBP7590761.1 ABC transporter ATP-binding protein [Chloroflexota bacterium]
MDNLDYDLKQIVTQRRLVGLWRILAGYRWLYLLAIVSIGLSALMRSTIYYALGYYVDNVLSSDGSILRQSLLVGTAVVGLALLQGALTFVSGRSAAKTAEGITRRLRNYLYDHIQRLSFTYHDNMQTGELLQRSTSDVDALRRLFAEQLNGIGNITLLFLVNFVALLMLNVRLALYSVVVIPFIIGVSLYFFKKVGEVYETYQEQEATLSNRLQENLSGVRVVKAFARQSYEIDMFEVDNQEKYRRGKRLIFMHASFWPVTDIMCGIQMLAGFFLGARMAINGIITPGEYLTYAGLVVLIIWPIRNLGRLITQMSTGLVSFDRVRDIIREDREPLDAGTYIPEDGLRGAVQFKNLHFAYDKETPVLHDISFDVEPGQVIALLGSTGSGKTSLVNLLPRFYDYTGGSLTLDGVELREYPRIWLRRQIGIVQQEPFLFSRSIRENITYGVGRTVSDAEVETAARAAAIHDVILSFPNGYETLVGERGVTLSGGQKQRVTIARTLLKNPRILIMDDATSSVDTETEASIRAALQGLMATRTTFVIAHRIQSVMDADLILVLDNGRIIQRGTHTKLLDQPGTYQQIYNLQARIEAELEKEIASVGSGSNGNGNGQHNGRFQEKITTTIATN